MTTRYALGFDFGTESVRVVVVDIRDGRIAGQAVEDYPSGVIDHALPGAGALPADYALQDPRDWLSGLGRACKSAMRLSGATIEQIVGIGVDFTSCTMLPALRDGTPLCCVEKFTKVPLAWPKLWKHHGAKAETDRVNEVARQRKEPWLARYGGIIGLEWFFPKVLETLNHEPAVYDAAEVYLEGGDWLVWQLVSGPFPRCEPAKLIRSTCQAGYKAMWNRQTGYPSPDYFAALHPKMRNVVGEKMPGTLSSPGRKAGELTGAAAELLGLRAGIPVSTAIIDAHSGVPGSGVAGAGALVMVMGTSSCHMLNSTVEQLAPGIAGVVDEGILPGFFGYETGQASVGDAFAWVSRTLGRSHEELTRGAAQLAPGSGGVIALDWLNGCRTPLMDGRLSGALVGLTLSTRPEQIYRAMLEATAFGVRWIVETFRDAGISVEQFVASGGLPGRSPLLMQIYADVLDATIRLPATDQSVALGAAILGACAAGPQVTGYATIAQAIGAMARFREDLVYRPEPHCRDAYAKLYPLYRALGQGAVVDVMRKLREG